MAFQIEPSGRLTATNSQPQVGDILENGIVMKVEVVSVSYFIMYAISGGIPLHGYDEVLVDERFVVSDDDVNGGAVAPDNDEGGIPTVIGGSVLLIWINYL